MGFLDWNYFTSKCRYIEAEGQNKAQFCFHFILTRPKMDTKLCISVGDGRNTF